MSAEMRRDLLGLAFVASSGVFALWYWHHPRLAIAEVIAAVVVGLVHWLRNARGGK